MKTPSRKSALEYAVAALTRRSHSVAELRKKMTEKLYAAQEIDSVLHLFLEKGFLNDVLYAENLCSVLTARGDGKKKIAGKLRLKGISPEIIAQTLAERETELTEEDSALAALQKKKHVFLREEDEYKRKEKALRFLGGRGFGIQAAFGAWEKFLAWLKEEDF